MLPGVITAQRHIIDLTDIHQLLATGIADRALHILLHLNERVGQLTFDRFQDALTFSLRVLSSGFALGFQVF